MHACTANTDEETEILGCPEYSPAAGPADRLRDGPPTRKLAPQAVGARTSPGLDPGDMSWEHSPGVVGPLASSPSRAALGQDERG